VLDAKRLIRIDAAGGLGAGLLMLALADWLAQLYGIPAGVVRGIAFANLAYGSVSATLAAATRHGRVPLLRAMAAANLGWAVICAGLAASWLGEATVLGVGSFVVEGAYVGGLGALEWRAAGRQPPRAPEPA
jgi:hypothetical protein